MTATVDFTAQWQDWHTARERTLAAPHGWLSLVSIDWLDEQPRGYHDLPGRWSVDGDAAVVEAHGGLSVDGDPIDGQRRFELVNSGPGLMITAGDRQVELANRSGYVIRIRDPKSPVRQAFDGVPAYEPSARWRLTGRYLPFDEPVPVTVGAVVEGLQHVYVSPGVVEFDHDGATHRLTAFNGPSDNTLNILFTDATSGVTTYPANRSLHVPITDDGAATLDFTRATNLPCAFTDFATCPLPPEGNHLPFAVEAGERTPAKH